MKHLKSTTDFLLHLRGMTTSEICKAYPRRFREPVWKGCQDEMVKDMLALDAAKWDVVGEYAKLMKQPLELWMFVPCDKNGIILEEPERVHFNTEFDYKAELSVYNEAKGRVLFDGFEISELGNETFIVNHSGEAIWIDTRELIEDLLTMFFEFEVTDSFIKKLRL